MDRTLTFDVCVAFLAEFFPTLVAFFFLVFSEVEPDGWTCMVDICCCRPLTMASNCDACCFNASTWILAISGVDWGSVFIEELGCMVKTESGR